MLPRPPGNGDHSNHYWSQRISAALLAAVIASVCASAAEPSPDLDLEWIKPPTKEEARAYALTRLDPMDAAALAMKHDGNTIRARMLLEQRHNANPFDPESTFALGCVLAADGDFYEAMLRYADATLDATEDLRRRIHQELRRLRSICVNLAEAGDLKAMLALGVAYEQGWGVAATVDEAKHWYRNAANAGSAKAMCRLAALYDVAIGASVHTVEADRWYESQAREWYTKSASLGCEEAKQWLTNHVLADPINPKQEHDTWIENNSKKELVGTLFDRDAPIKLFVAEYEGDDPKTHRDSRLGTGLEIMGWEVAQDGNLSGYHMNDRGQGGGGGEVLAQAELAQLDNLLSSLPDDGSRLPPPNRKLLLQALVGSKIVTRVYDRANAPELIWKILGMAQCKISPFFPKFEPESLVEARGFEHDGFLCLSPDGRELLFTGMNQPLQFWEPATHEFLREIRGLRGDAIAFSPDGAQAVISERWLDCQRVDTKTWKFQKEQVGSPAPQFTADGHFILMPDGEHPIRIFDAETWKAVERVPGIPKNAIKYLPALQIRRAILQTESGVVSLWDPDGEREIAKLHEGAVLRQAAFSPDESLVAVETEATENGREISRFGVWHSITGQLVQEFRPYDRNTNECARGLLWSLDGEYILASVGPWWGSDDSVGIFSSKTGRQRGEFTGCSRINGAVLLPDSSQFVVGCMDGKIRFWNFPKALETVKAFEASIEHQ